MEEPEGRPGGLGTLKLLGVTLLALLSLLGPPGVPSGSSMGSISLQQTISA